MSPPADLTISAGDMRRIVTSADGDNRRFAKRVDCFVICTRGRSDEFRTDAAFDRRELALKEVLAAPTRERTALVRVCGDAPSERHRIANYALAYNFAAYSRSDSAVAAGDQVYGSFDDCSCTG